MKPILVSGSLAYDRIMDFPGLFKDHFLPDALHTINVSFLVAPPSENFGGCAGNIAYGLALLSAPSEVVESAGCDFDRYAERLFSLGIESRAVQVHDDVTTASAYIITDKADNQITAFSEGASARRYDKPVLAERYAFAILGTSSVENSRTVAKACAAANIAYYFDPGQKTTAFSADELRELIEGSDGLLVNDYEARMIAEKTGWSEKDMAEKASFLVVTLGTEGSRILTPSGEERVTAVKAEKLVDPTGAGDAYRAGFLRGLLAGLPLTASAKLGSAVAAYAVESYGTQNHRFSLDELKGRYEAAYQETFPL